MGMWYILLIRFIRQLNVYYTCIFLAIGKSGLGKSLREEGHFTLFAPSDSAFRKLDPVLLSRILDGDTDCLISELGFNQVIYTKCTLKRR